MNHRFPRAGRSVCLALLPILAIACGESAGQISTTTGSVDHQVPTSSLPSERTTTVVEQAATTESPSTTAPANVDRLPLDALSTLVDQLPGSLGVEGVVVGVTIGDQSWLGAAGVDDTATDAPMTTDRRFRAASITKLYVDAAVLSLIDEGALSLEDRLAEWFPTFPNANDITVQMLMSHTAGVTTDWWLNPDLLQLALDDLGRTWTPREVIELMTTRPPAGPPGGAALYSNAGFVLLGEIAAQVAGTTIGGLIEDRVIRPLGLEHTTFGFENPPDLAHAYYDFQGQTIDVTAMPMQAMLSMAGAAGAIQTDATDLLAFVHALFGTDELLTDASRAFLSPDTPVPDRFWHGAMGYCPCETSSAGTVYSGWGHAGDIPGYFSTTAYFPASDTSVVVFLNRDIVDGVTFQHDALDLVIEQVAVLLEDSA